MDRRSTSVMDPPARPGKGRYSSRIIKAGALLPDTKTLFSYWDASATVPENLDRIRRENVFGKASRSRVEDILAVFRQRYLADEEVLRGLVVLVQERLPAASLDRILYFHAARSDRLLHDVVTEWLAFRLAEGRVAVDTASLQRVLGEWVAQGKTTSRWSDETTGRVAQGLLSTLRDFGVLQGSVHKRIAPPHLPLAAFCYVMFYLKQQQPSGLKLVDHRDWRLFLLDRGAVERLLLEAHQHGLLEYHAAGSVIRLTFPASNLAEYADVITKR
ncbi:MAG: BrxA family protein [Isosphaeraceae bacterium]